MASYSTGSECGMNGDSFLRVWGKEGGGPAAHFPAVQEVVG